MRGKRVLSSHAHALEHLEDRRLFSLTTSLVPVVMPASALKADPTLANYNILDLQVTLDPGERWAATDLDAELTSGNFYNVSAANGGADFVQKSVWSILPAVQADTAVSASGFGRPTILGKFNPFGGPAVFTSTSVNAAFGALQDTGTGTFTVARLTVSKNANGTIIGDEGSTETDANHLKPYSFVIQNGQPVSLSSISGTVFNDSNGNGKNDEASALSGFKVYLDKNNNGAFDTGEKNTLTDANGAYSFPSLTPGTYYVREILPTGYRRTAPSSSKYTVTLSNGVNGTAKDFGNTTTALLSGTVFSDKNSNDKLDSGEAGLAGFTIWLDTNNNGKLDTGEKTAGTDSNGYWVFKAVKPGSYVVRIQAKTGYKTIGVSSINMKLASGGSYTGRLFAEHKLA